MEKNIQEIEEWRDVDGYEGFYQVSSLGRVRSCDRYESCDGGTRLRKGRILKPQIIKNGYLQVPLYKEGKRIALYVHRLVGIAFPEICGQFRNGLEVDHINTLKTDNRAVNLRWCTHSENHLNPLTRKCKSNLMKGENAPWYGKLGKYNPNSIPILQYDLEGNFIAEWDSAASAERQLGIWNQSIAACCRGRYKTAGGYIFKYKTA